MDPVPRRPEARPHRRHRRQPRPRRRPRRASSTRSSASAASRASSSTARTTTSARRRRTRSSTSPGPSKKKASTAPRLDNAALTAFFDDLGWLDLNNARRRARGARHPPRVLRRQRPAHPLRPGRGHPRRARRAARERPVLRRRDLAGRRAQPPSASTVTIGVTHSPYRRVLDAFVTYGASMIFAGHTHGGQVCVPGFGALVTNCDIPRAPGEGPQHLAPRLPLGVPERLGRARARRSTRRCVSRAARRRRSSR